ncbi:hypothetical protein DPMN_046038 [Dreissena polymorpha]|uniref:Uncharacterized protein n=1 Tax=Dreissena polymorpha TaxID=45954 RepID=A0A9D4D7N6_DREPO|nr:hypothetical protein DPMN_046038 [Dreissena polymorpha]
MPRPSWFLKETHRRCKMVTQTVGAPSGDSQTVYDVGKNVWAPIGDSHTVPDNIHYRRGKSRRIPDSQDRPGTCRRLPDGVTSLSDRRGTCTRLPYSL